MRFLPRLSLQAFMAAVVLAVALLPLPVAASIFGSGTFGSCQFGACSITLTSNTSVSLNVVPTASGSCTLQHDTVSVQTDASSGYTLSMNSTDEVTSLENGSHTISTSAATVASPTTLSMNRWGYRVDGAGSFGPGPTTAATNASSLTPTFAGVAPFSSGGALLVETASAASTAEETQVWYGVCTDTSVAAGVYAKEVLYTALTN